MRTEVSLPDDVYEAARSLSVEQNLSLDEALALLVRRGHRPAVSIDTSKPFPCFALPPDAEPITLDQALAAEDEL